MGTALHVQGLTKEFGKHVVLDNVSFDVQEGEIFGIIGMSGSGKTTLLNHLIGFVDPDEGDVSYNSVRMVKKNGARIPITQLVSLRKHASEVRRRFGFVPQTPSFYPKLTVKENISHFAALHNIKKSVATRHVQNLLSLTRLDPHKKVLAENLSGGMQRRLSIACGLIHQPDVLILDEPTADLDPLLAEDMWRLIRAINKQGTTVVVASHFLHEIEAVCDRVGIVHNGKMIRYGTLDEVKKGITNGNVEICVETDRKSFPQIIANITRQNIAGVHDGGDRLTLYTTQPQQTLFELARMIKSGVIESKSLEVSRPSLKEVFEVLART